MTINQHTEYLRNYFNQIEAERPNIQRRDGDVDLYDPSRPDNQCFSLENDKVTLEELKSYNLGSDLVRSLYEDSNTIRLLKQKRYNEPEILNQSQGALEDLQIRYLMKEIDRPLWGKQIYRVTSKKNQSLLIATVLNLYLITVDSLQSSLKENGSVENQQKVKKQLVSLIQLCNDSFDSLYEEDGGTHHHFRNVNDSHELPAYT